MSKIDPKFQPNGYLIYVLKDESRSDESQWPLKSHISHFLSMAVLKARDHTVWMFFFFCDKILVNIHHQS